MYINCILMQGFCFDMLLLTVNVMYGASRCCLILRSEVSLPSHTPDFGGFPFERDIFWYHLAGFCVGFIVWGRSPKWPKSEELPRGVRVHATPEIF